MKRLRLIAMAVAVFLLGWLVIHPARSKEPTYQGRALTEWLRTGDDLTLSTEHPHNEVLPELGRGTKESGHTSGEESARQTETLNNRAKK
jgi:hypothetical protein